ncbi:hypothetical protein [Aminobacter sp. MSH1]|uniref:hypothetical protein n=1 Tax=Aminobacter sp. MSH1 TaxID=374606 RepID=UPI00131EE9B7|nr:hypothetical protein [Aminobacter sp. MSH1]
MAKFIVVSSSPGFWRRLRISSYMDLRLPSRRLHRAVTHKAEIEIMALHEKLIRFREIIILRVRSRTVANPVRRIAAPATGEPPAP